MNLNGPMLAIVTNNTDPEALGRVQVRIPALGGREPAAWARLLSPRAGLAQGIFFRPEIGDEVLVHFLDGDPRQPVILGSLWSRQNPPPTALAEQSTIRTRSGHTLVFDDAHDGECIEITSRGGHSILLSDEAGSGRIEISNPSNGSRIVIDEDGLITIAADSNDIHISSTGGDVTISGVNVRLAAQSQLDLRGAAGVAVESSGATHVRGALLQLDGATTLNGQPLP